MIFSIPTIAPISDLRVRQPHIVALAKDGSVVLIERRPSKAS